MRPELSSDEAALFTRANVLGDATRQGSAQHDLTLHVTPGRDGAHETLQSAVDAAIRVSAGNDGVTIATIALSGGDHAGVAIIPALDHLRLRITGQGAGATRIHASTHARMTGQEYAKAFGSLFATSPPEVRRIYEAIAASPQIGTGNTAILRVCAKGTDLADLTVENTYNCDRTEDTPPEDNARRNGQGQWSDETHQAVALMLDDADGAVCRNLHLKSFQDTFYLQQTPDCLRARYHVQNCRVDGDIDFIFGPATAYFEGCEIRSLGARSQNSWAVAPSTALDQDFGFVFESCRFTHDGSPNARRGRFKLARQWFRGVRLTPYGVPPDPSVTCRLGDENRFDPLNGCVTRDSLRAVGKCVVMRSDLGDHIDTRSPWDAWKGGEYFGDGRWNARDWSPCYRPAQYHASDLAANLAAWPDFANAGLDARGAIPVLLAEFANGSTPIER